MKGNKVSGVVVATPFGRGVVLADVVIDSTGNADIAAAAGADTHYGISAHGDLSVQVAGYPDRGLGQGTNNTGYGNNFRTLELIFDTSICSIMYY